MLTVRSYIKWYRTLYIMLTVRRYIKWYRTLYIMLTVRSYIKWYRADLKVSPGEGLHLVALVKKISKVHGASV